jgi:hypothetical protein
MSQIFHRSTNALARFTIFGAIFFLAGLTWIWWTLNRTYSTRQDVVVQQPVPFSHEHHVEAMGIHCLYCHTTVEDSKFAGIPPTATCMNCHKTIWDTSPTLAPVRASFANGTPIEWRRVNDLPDFVYFNHSIHIKKGIGCATCHGRVDKMPLMRQARSLEMAWCLDCHRDPAKYVRPRDQIFNMAWKADDQETLGKELVQKYHVRSLTNCSTCHR